MLKKQTKVVEEKAVEKLKVAKGMGSGWWNTLDAKSKAAFQEAKRFYIDKKGMSEAEADLKLQQLAAKVGDRYELMRNPETYKTFIADAKAEAQERMPGLQKQASSLWGDMKDEYNERMPGVIDKTKILIKDAQIQLASGEKVAVAVAKETKKQTLELVEAGKENIKETGVTMVNATNNAIHNISNSSSVQTGGQQLQPAGTATMEYFNSIVYTLDTD